MRVSQELEQWADGRNTSREIASVIEDLAKFDPDEMERLWQNPSDDEMQTVIRLAWAMADPDENTLHWGCERITRVL